MILVEQSIRILAKVEQHTESDEEKRNNSLADGESGWGASSVAGQYVSIRESLSALLHICCATPVAKAASAVQCCEYLLRIPRSYPQFVAFLDAQDKRLHNSSGGVEERTEVSFAVKFRDFFHPASPSSLSFPGATVDGESAPQSEHPTTAIMALEEECLFHIDQPIGKDLLFGPFAVSYLSKYDTEATSLHLAAVNGHLEIVKLFVEGWLVQRVESQTNQKQQDRLPHVIGQEAREQVHAEQQEEEPALPSPIKKESGEEDPVPEHQDTTATSKFLVDANQSSLAQFAPEVLEAKLRRGGRLLIGNISAVDRMGKNALHYAAEFGGALVSRNPAAGNSPTRQYRSALGTAATSDTTLLESEGNVAMLQVLLDVCPEAVLVQDRGGRTPLEAALRANQNLNATFLMQYQQQAPSNGYLQCEAVPKPIVSVYDEVAGQQRREQETRNSTTTTAPNKSYAASNTSSVLHHIPEDAKITVGGVEYDARSLTSGDWHNMYKKFHTPSAKDQLDAKAAPTNGSASRNVSLSMLNASGMQSLPPAVAASSANGSLWRAHTRGVVHGSSISSKGNHLPLQ